MSKPSTFAKGAFAVLAGGLALSAAATAPTAVAAQPYGYTGSGYGGAYYDPCRRDQVNRGTVGALLGAGIGATVGSQVAASGHRTDGSLVGGALGALVGAGVGKTSAGCASGYAPPPPPPPPPPRVEYRPAPAPYAYAAPAYRWHADDDDDDDHRWAYGRRGERFRVADRPVGADGCTLAESPIYLPDGRVQKRFVRVCMDSSGRYQVVD